MPLVIGHAFLGASVAALSGSAGRRPLSLRDDGKALVLAAALGVLPDLDLFFTWILGMGIKWHGGFTHSITLAAIFGWLCARYAGKGTIRGGRLRSRHVLAWVARCGNEEDVWRR